MIEIPGLACVKVRYEDVRHDDDRKKLFLPSVVVEAVELYLRDMSQEDWVKLNSPTKDFLWQVYLADANKRPISYLAIDDNDVPTIDVPTIDDELNKL